MMRPVEGVRGVRRTPLCANNFDLGNPKNAWSSLNDHSRDVREARGFSSGGGYAYPRYPPGDHQ